MNVVDSSAWLEYFADGPNAGEFAKPIEATRSLIVPTLSLFEVFKRIAQQRGDDEALRGVAVMEQGRVVDLDRATALAAARIVAREFTQLRAIARHQLVYAALGAAMGREIHALSIEALTPDEAAEE